MLSTALYNSARHGTPGTRSFTRQRLYYTATIEQWRQDTFLGRRTQERGRNFLRHHGLFSEEHYFQNARIFTHINSHVLMKMLEANTRLSKVYRPAKTANSTCKQSQLPLDTHISSDLESDISANSDMTDCASPDLESDKLYISDVSNCTSSDLESDISANSDMTDCASPDLESDKLYISDVSNCTSISSNNYNNLPTEGITTTTNIGKDSQPCTEVDTGLNVVVVSENVNVTSEAESSTEFKPAGKYAGLIFPTNMKSETHRQAVKIFAKYYPAAKPAELQELLDEVGGYGRNASNPLGILSKITRAACIGQFTAVKAPQYKAARIAAEKSRLAQIKKEQEVREAYSQQQETNGNKHSFAKNKPDFDNLKKILDKKQALLK